MGGCVLKGTSMGEGQDVRPGNTVMFQIQAGDRFFNPRSTGGDYFIVKLQAITATARPEGGIVKDLGNGVYNGSFTVSKAGRYSVFVGVSYLEKYETAIFGSPFTIFVNPIDCQTKETLTNPVVPYGCPDPTLDEEPVYSIQCSSHGCCADDGKCQCDAAFDGDNCEFEITKPYMDAIIIENAVIGALVVLYGA